MNYQISKTIKFGLTTNPKENKCHTELAELVSISEKSIVEEARRNNSYLLNDNFNFLEYTYDCLIEINNYIVQWEIIQKRNDLLFFTFVFYKQLARKARFDARWIDRDNKNQPSKNKLVSLKILSTKFNNKKRIEYITNYWENNLFDTKQKSDELKIYLKKYKEAISDSQTHKSLNLVEFRKICLQLFRLVNETLTPLYQNSITLDNKRGQLSDKDKFIDTFYNNLPLLVVKIEKLKTYFSENGGYVPFGRVTLNKKTASQKPHKFDFNDVFQDKKNFISNDFVENLYNYALKFTDYDENKEDKITKAVEHFIKYKSNKIELYKDENLCILERVQYFKFKNIPLSVRYPLADFFAKERNWDVEILRKIFDAFGNPISLNKEYFDKKGNFNFEEYPLKAAFDFAWDSAAKSIIYNTNIEAPIQKSIDYLGKYFNITLQNKNLILYAYLLDLNQHLAVLDHTDESIEKRLETKTKVNNTIISIQNNYPELKNEWFDSIQKRLDYHDNKQVDLKDNIFNTYNTAKQKLGQIRGMQKLKYNKSTYYTLTDSFKKVSLNYGNGFSSIREKLSESTILNKIDYLGVIVEDKNKDRYLLIKQLSDTREEVENLFVDNVNGDYTFFEVQSLTSKALEKIIRNPNSENSNKFHIHNKIPLEEKDFIEKFKKEWFNYKDDNNFLNYLKDCLKNSTMAQNQNWASFNLDIDNLNTFDEIAKEVDRKLYRLVSKKISKESIENMVQQGAKLLPIVNQDITSKTKLIKNQFSKDWVSIFEKKGLFRLHPEFNISYRMPTPNYPKPEEKRYSRFQMIGQFMIEHYPDDKKFMTRKEQIVYFNDTKKHKTIAEFNKPIYSDKNEKYIIGIDRGMKELATLCLLNPQGQIQGGFKIYTRTFNKCKKRFEHNFKEERDILDLTNLRVETTVCVDGVDKTEKVLVDLALMEVAVGRDKENNPLRDEFGKIITKENKQKVKLKQMAYWRKIQFAFINSEKNEDIYMYFIENVNILENGELTEDFIKQMPHISPYGEGTAFEDFPFEDFRQLALKFIQHKKNDTLMQLNDELELSSVDDLKKGIVANMIGVVVFIVNMIYQKHKTIPLISLENLCRAWSNIRSNDGLTGYKLGNSYHKSNTTNKEITFKEKENLFLSGLGLHHFFEMQLLKKLSKLNLERNYPYPLVPPIRAVKDYEVVAQLTKYENEKYFCKDPYGIVSFVDPDNTSKACPCCGNIENINRNKIYDEISCPKCNFLTIWYLEQQENLTPKTHEKRYTMKDIEKSKNALKKNNKILNGEEKTYQNLEFIHNGDDNAAYNIALKALINLKQK